MEGFPRGSGDLYRPASAVLEQQSQVLYAQRSMQTGPIPSVSHLTDELSRRLNISDQAQLLVPELPQSNDGILWPPRVYFCEFRHNFRQSEEQEGAREGELVARWRTKERLKTVAVALVLCLNIGVDPPDVIKISPCARLECWVDPLSMQPGKALETIGKNLQAQYERWQPRAKYKMHLDPTMDDVKKLAISCRRTAKHERVLFHYNGHGVPRPTQNGEIWVFNKSYTQYIPLSIYDLQSWLGLPAIYVFDCSAAGLIVKSFRQFADQRAEEEREALAQTQAAGGAHPILNGADGGPSLENPMKEAILLAACGEMEVLPQSPEIPADVFTACLTTPIKVALRWFTTRSLLRAEGLTKDLIDRIPGKQTDRKTPLGELNWIFTAITDTIAWNCLPRALFQRLFRQDLVVASLFRNFLLAERILRACNCCPMSFPRLPPTHQHPMWQAWDMAAELCLLQLPALLEPGSTVEFQPSPFFSEQLTAFELWLEHGSRQKKPPEQLPIVLQVLLSQVHRLRALVLLGRLLDMGAWAVDLALSVGIFPYVLKLLQTTAIELRHTLVFIWAKILALDRHCQHDLVKDHGYIYFIKYLESADPSILPDSRAQAAFVLATVCEGNVKGQALCMAANLVHVLCNRLIQAVGALQQGGSPLFTRWLCLCLGQLIQDLPEAIYAAEELGASNSLRKLLLAGHPEIRAAAVFALGCFILVKERTLPPEVLRADGYANGGGAGMLPGPPMGMPLGIPPPMGPLLNPNQLRVLPYTERQVLERDIALSLMPMTQDASPCVRSEVAVALGRLAAAHSVYFEEAISAQQHQQACALQRAATDKRGGSAGAAHSAPSEGIVGKGLQQAPRHSGSLQEKPVIPIASSPVLSGEHMHSPAHSLSGSNPTSSPRPGTPPTGSFSSMPRPLGQPSPGQAELGEVSLTPETESAFGSAAEAPRVGGGIYENLLTAMCQLALDPFPQVEELGSAALRMLGASLIPYHGFKGAGVEGLRGGTGAMAVGGRGTPIRSMPTAPAQMPTPTPGSGSGSLWNRPHLWGSRSASPATGISLGSMAGSSFTGIAPLPSQPRHPEIFSARLPFMLVRVEAADVNPRSSSGDLPRDDRRPSHPQSPQAGSRAGEEQVVLPQSPAYLSSCLYFCHPLLDPQATVWRQTQWSGEVAASGGLPIMYDPARISQRLHERDHRISRLRSLPKEASIRLKEDGVTELKMHAPVSVALLLHPFRPLVTVADPQGIIRSYNYHHPPHPNFEHHPAANAFHLLTGSSSMGSLSAEDGKEGRAIKGGPLGAKPPGVPPAISKASMGASIGKSAKDIGTRGDQGASPAKPTISHRESPSTQVVNMFHINETHAGVLVAGTADGSVYVWRNYTSAHNQRLATAWRAVSVEGAAGTWRECRAATFEWSELEGSGCLYAAGGSSPHCICAWDAATETCTLELEATPAISGAAFLPPAVVFLKASRSQPLLVAACDNGFVQLFDMRAQCTPVASTRPSQHDSSRIVGMVLEPGGEENKLVTGVAKGWVQFIDFRVMRDAVDGTAYEMGTWKSFDAVKTGHLSSISGHPHAPIIATGTTDQVVRLWNPQGDKLSSMRIATKLMASRMGPISQLAFHPYRLLFAGGGQDRLLTIYTMSSGTAAGPSPSPDSSTSSRMPRPPTNPAPLHR